MREKVVENDGEYIINPPVAQIRAKHRVCYAYTHRHRVKKYNNTKRL